MDEPRIVLFDLETMPDFKEAMKVWPQISSFPGKTLKATISTIICAGYKVLGESKTHCLNVWDYDGCGINDDKKLVKDLFNVLSVADAVVTHNGRRFDWKFFQTRLIKNGLKPLHKIPHIDTKQLASSNLMAFNNRLGYLGDQFCKDEKLDHEGWELWNKVLQGNKAARKTMTKYCKQDVDLLEKLFIKLRPFATNIPNYNVFQPAYAGGKQLCPTCGGTRLKSHGWRHTKTQSYQRKICLNCGTVSRVDKKGEMPRSI